MVLLATALLLVPVVSAGAGSRSHPRTHVRYTRRVVSVPAPTVQLTKPVVVAADPFVVSDDPATGKIVAENSLIKVVWGYLPLSSEFNNRSGGCIYGLFDKTTDPGLQHNLVQLIAYGSGGSSPSHAGIGGLGATKAYINNSTKAITEVGTHATLLAETTQTLADGTLVVSFTYQVNDPNGVPQYQIAKTWTLQQSGKIALHTTWLWLVTTEVNDPNYNFALSRDYGFTRVGWLTHQWSPTTCGGLGTNGLTNFGNKWVVDGSVATEADKDIGTKHVQKYLLAGAATGTKLAIAINPDNGGYESSGLFKFGYDAWAAVDGAGATQEITGEFSNYHTSAYGYELRWGSWYSNDGGSTRYRHVAAQTSWSDDFTIALSH
jgi:hypothetical protein